MTEHEWLTAIDPRPLLEYLRYRASNRKLRLFACACCRRIWHLLTDARSRRAVEVTERWADGAPGPNERRSVAGVEWAAQEVIVDNARGPSAVRLAIGAARSAVAGVAYGVRLMGPEVEQVCRDSVYA